MKLFIVKLFSVLLIFSSCSRVKLEKFDSFNKYEQLTGKIIGTDDKYKRAILHYHDSLLLLTNTPENKYQLHIYDNEYNKLKSDIEIGNGPGQLINPFIAKINDRDKFLYYMDMARRKIFKYNIDSLIRNDNYYTKDFIKTPKRTRAIVDFNIVNDSTNSFLDFESNDNLISFFSSNGKRKDYAVRDKIKMYDKVEELNGHPIATYGYDKHPTKNLYCIVYRFSDVVAIVDEAGNVYNAIQGPDNINQKPNRRDRSIVTTYTNVKCDSNYIYCLYKKRGKEFTQRNKNEYYGAKALHIFDWEGTPVACVDFDYSVFSYVINKRENKIITMSTDNGELIEYHFNFNTLL